MNTSLNESTARDWLETHATTDVAGTDDDPERIDELARYEGEVNGQRVQTDRADPVGRFVKHRPDGSIRTVEALYERNGRCAFVRTHEAYDVSRARFVLNTLKAMVGARPVQAPDQDGDIQEAQNILAGSAMFAALLPLGAYGLSVLDKASALHFPSFVLTFLGSFGALGAAVIVVLTAIEAGKSYRTEPEKTVKLFDAGEAETKLRSTAPKLAQTLYGEKPGYFEEAEREEPDPNFLASNNTDS